MSTTGRSSAPEQLEFDFCQSSRLRADHEPLLTITEACGVFNRKPHALRRAIVAAINPPAIGTATAAFLAPRVEHQRRNQGFAGSGGAK